MTARSTTEPRGRPRRGLLAGAAVLVTGLVGVALAVPAGAQDPPQPDGTGSVPTFVPGEDGEVQPQPLAGPSDAPLNEGDTTEQELADSTQPSGSEVPPSYVAEDPPEQPSAGAGASTAPLIEGRDGDVGQDTTTTAAPSD